MYSLWHNEVLAEAHQKELEDKAQLYRLRKASNVNSPVLSRKLREWIGEQMVNLGERIQDTPVQPHHQIQRQLDAPTCS
ncbi:MAG: hypothetical protein AAF702_41915 [Chloroflexota bacterium]